MNRFSIPLIAFLAFFTITMTGCAAISGIFKAGIWTGVIGIALVVFLIIYLISRSRK